MIAENDLALGEMVEEISKSPIWEQSLILVIEDDSQNGADHVDAHRIPAFAISPYARRGAVVHTRYDFLSFIRTFEIPLGLKPLNLFDALATPLYNAFTSKPANAEPYEAITPRQPLLERNSAGSPNSRLSQLTALATASARADRPLPAAPARQDPVAVRTRPGLRAPAAGPQRLVDRRAGGAGIRALRASVRRASPALEA
ncbi:MAG: hypothetical protein M3Q43_06730 [Actinomycetota bacterium]|nr:hypothetical protein [Actinomycetota bacterium]